MSAAKNIAVIGAGVSGLNAARHLASAGFPVTVFERSRNPGGRCATRHSGNSMYDHGAQYFTASDNGFRQQLAEWLENDIVARWIPRLAAVEATGPAPKTGGPARYTGVGGMRALAGALSEGLTVRHATEVADIHDSDGRFRLQTSAGEFLCDAVVVALPPTQAAPLLSGFAELRDEVESHTFEACWALMAAFVDRLEPGYDAAFVNHGPLRWICRDSSKPGRAVAPDRWVVHAGGDWSAGRLREDPHRIAESLLAEFFACTGLPPQVPELAMAHRWGSAMAHAALQTGFLAAPGRPMLVCGDWCHGSKIEGAFVSGRKAARAIMEML